MKGSKFMNAQEAIELIEEELNELNEMERIVGKKGYFRAEQHTKALEIVLESAKLFHFHTVPEVIEKSRSYVQLPDGSDREYTHMFGVSLKKLGIDVN